MITVSMQHSLCLLLFTCFFIYNPTFAMEVYKNLLGLSERGGRGQPATLTTVSCLGLGRRPTHPYTQRATTLKNVHYNLLHSKKELRVEKACVLRASLPPIPCSGFFPSLASLIGMLGKHTSPFPLPSQGRKGPFNFWRQ